MTIDLEKLLTQMAGAALPILKQKAPNVGNLARGELLKIAQTVLTIQDELDEGQITPEQARLLFDIQKSATRAVLMAAEGLSLLIVESSLNAALDVLKKGLTSATPWL